LSEKALTLLDDFKKKEDEYKKEEEKRKEELNNEDNQDENTCFKLFQKGFNLFLETDYFYEYCLDLFPFFIERRRLEKLIENLRSKDGWENDINSRMR